MYNAIHFKRALALSTALSVVALGATTTAAEASLDPGKSQGKSQAKDKSQGKAKGHAEKSSSSRGGSKQGGSQSALGQGNGKAKGHSKDEDQPSGNSQSSSQGSSQGGSTAQQDGAGPRDKGSKGKGGDPAGNNGTVKITPHGEVDGIPQNTPHVGCDFDVEWYGFDEGADIISTVTFEAWSPTRGVLEVVTGDLRVFVGADPASGAGAGSDEDGTDADNGFDGEEHYELAFPGIEPHPKQGYHVKLTINTPGSQGADVKHKVFWVQECDTQETPPLNPENPENPETPDVAGEEGNNLETEVETDIEILGEQAVAPEVNGAEGDQAVPNAVDAGLAQKDVVSSISTLPLMLTLYGALIAGLALLMRRRRTS